MSVHQFDAAPPFLNDKSGSQKNRGQGPSGAPCTYRLGAAGQNN